MHCQFQVQQGATTLVAEKIIFDFKEENDSAAEFFCVQIFSVGFIDFIASFPSYGYQ